MTHHVACDMAIGEPLGRASLGGKFPDHLVERRACGDDSAVAAVMQIVDTSWAGTAKGYIVSWVWK